MSLVREFDSEVLLYQRCTEQVVNEDFTPLVMIGHFERFEEIENLEIYTEMHFIASSAFVVIVSHDTPHLDNS